MNNMTNKAPFRCNSCYRETSHTVLYTHKDGGREQLGDDEDPFWINWGRASMLIVCDGCQNLSMVQRTWNSEVCDDHGRPEISETYFPPRIFRALPKWIDMDDLVPTLIPVPILTLMHELYINLQNDCRAAAAMIMRAVLEHTMIDKVGDQGSFEQNLTSFTAGGFISSTQADVARAVIDTGNAAIHRAFTPRRSDVLSLVDIIEVVLKVVYVHAPEALEIRNRTPKRNRQASQ